MANDRNVVFEVVFDRLPELAGQLRERASEAVRKTALDIEAGAKAIVPVDTGNLKNSIQTKMEDDLTATIGTHVEYAPYVEYGTHRMAAQPYLTPSAEKARPGFEQAMKELLR